MFPTLPKVYSLREKLSKFIEKNVSMFDCSWTIQLSVDFSNNCCSTSGTHSIISYNSISWLNNNGLCWMCDFIDRLYFNRNQMLYYSSKINKQFISTSCLEDSDTNPSINSRNKFFYFRKFPISSCRRIALQQHDISDRYISRIISLVANARLLS